MNSLLLTFDFPPALGGISVAMSRILRCLKEEKIAVLTSDIFTKEKPQMSLKEDFSLTRVDFNIDVSSWRLPFELIKVFKASLKIHRKRHFSEILVGEVFPLGLIGIIFKFFFGVKFITFSHGSDSLFSKNKLRDFLTRAIYRSADCVICFSDYTRANLLKWGLNARRVKKVHLGVDTNIFMPGVDVKAVVEKFNLNNRILILTVNRLTERKGIDLCLRALRELIADIPNILYLIVGDGPDVERLRRMVKDMQLENYVIFAGAVKQEELPPIYCACDIFINAVREIKKPGRNETEGLGLVNLEASACAKPVIAGATGGVVDAVDNNRTGLLIDPNNISELREAILRFIKDKQLAAKMGQAGRERVLRQYTMDNMRKEILEVLNY